MNRAALEETFATGKVHFWSRSRGTLWMKGETSGNVLNVVAMLVDCDQDALLIRAAPTGPTCHTGARSCFYRKLVMGDDGPALAHTDA
jgi:phosphoribosyl-AMP cyclohydrolase